MVQPPNTTIADDMPAREYVFIVDVSGSMAGFPLSVSKKLIANILGGLRSKDSFNIMFFAGGSYQLSPRSVPATEANITRALRVLDEQHGSGGTNLVAALESALKMPVSDSTSRTFVAITDGFITVDDSAFAMVRKNLGRANFFAFGVGSSVNRNLINGLARAGMGEPFVAINAVDANKQARKFHKLIASPMLTQVRAKFRGFEAYDVIPKAIPDLFSDRPLIIFGKYRGRAEGSIEVSGVSGRGKFHSTLQVEPASPTRANAGLRYLWATQRIAELSDRIAFGETKELKQQVTGLGLSYNLLTRYTSFVAVDPRARNSAGNPLVVKQSLPQPSGVNPPVPQGGYIQSPSRNISASIDTEFILSTTSAFGIGLRLNLGLGHHRIRDTKDDQLGLAYGAELSWAAQVSRVVLQPYLGVTGLALREQAESFLELGTILQIGDSWGLGTEVQVGLTDASATIATGLFLRHRH